MRGFCVPCDETTPCGCDVWYGLDEEIHPPPVLLDEKGNETTYARINYELSLGLDPYYELS